MKCLTLKVILITQGVSRVVYPLIRSKYHIVGVLESAPRDYDPNQTRSFLFKIAKSLYCLFLKRNETLKDVAEKNGLSYRFMQSSDDPGLELWVRKLKPDVIAVFSMSQLLKRKIYSIPTFGTINLHPSFLPAYRGPNPDFWQYYDMEMNPGVTIHYIDKGEDTGDIICQEKVPITLGIKSPERLDKLISEVGVKILIKALDAIANRHVVAVIQQRESPTERARNLKLGEHGLIIDWHNWPVERIWHLLRGTELWLNALPSPKGIYYGQRWTVGEFEKFTGQNYPYGNIYKRHGRYCVSVKEGCIYLDCFFKIKNFILKMFEK